MIENFSYVDKKVTCSTPEDLIEASGNFTYYGTGSIADTDYDKIWTYIGFDDGHVNQLEFWHLTSETSSAQCHARWLVDGVVVSETSYNGSGLIPISPTSGSGVPYRFIQIKSGNTVIIEFFAWRGGSGSGYNGAAFSMHRNLEVYANNPVLKGRFRALRTASGVNWFYGSSDVSGPKPFSEDTFVVARPVYFKSTSDNDPWTEYLYDNTSFYKIQNSTHSDSTELQSIIVSEWTEIELDNKHFIAIYPRYEWNTTYSLTSGYMMFLRIS